MEEKSHSQFRWEARSKIPGFLSSKLVIGTNRTNNNFNSQKIQSLQTAQCKFIKLGQDKDLAKKACFLLNSVSNSINLNSEIEEAKMQQSLKTLELKGLFSK